MSKKRKKKKNHKKKKSILSPNRAGTRKSSGKKVCIAEFSEIPVLFKNRVEFFRNGMALVAGFDEPDAWGAYLVEHEENDARTGCSCVQPGCIHQEKIAEVYRAYKSPEYGLPFYESFRQSIFYKLATPVIENSPVAMLSLALTEGTGSATDSNHNYAEIQDASGATLITYVSADDSYLRFVERFRSPKTDRESHRGAVLQELARQTLTKNERFFLETGSKSKRQVREESAWYRAAYHCYREFSEDGCDICAGIDESTGVPFLKFSTKTKNASTLTLNIPSQEYESISEVYQQLFPSAKGIEISGSCTALYEVKKIPAQGITLTLVVQYEGEDGVVLFKKPGHDYHRHGNIVFLKKIGITVHLVQPEILKRRFGNQNQIEIKKDEVPGFLHAVGRACEIDTLLIDQDNNNLQIFSRFDGTTITTDAMSRDWCWLSVDYGFGRAKFSLIDILRARQEKRLLETEDGWIDCMSPEFEGFETISYLKNAEQNADRPGSLRISRTDLLKINTISSSGLEVKGDEQQVLQIENMLELKPPAPLPKCTGLLSSLRSYQEVGVEWLVFLYENHFGGLLCDDMGLGKTHQVMGLMVYIREAAKSDKPFLVVCPVTVISHWLQKIKQYAPGLNCVCYHGGERDLELDMKEGDVIITSYGVLLRDINVMRDIAFELAVFDEAQHIKNQGTLAHKASREINASTKLVLTGTPIENTIIEMKALMDLTIPGYLGSDAAFSKRYTVPIEQHANQHRRKELQRTIAPFTLRRMKRTVLKDLPEKIEDIRSCRLSSEQVALYREAITANGKAVLQTLQAENEQVPYIHVFALLTLLKQICNHPASLKNKSVSGYESHQSGKWDLFVELMDEGLESGQKIVVYSQFLNMIEIISNHLKNLGVDFSTLTGSTRNRGKCIDRFNNDPDCKVFVSSLKAGGTGIDLVGGSIVIHYDRWWNAAKEDQATDRVHRIGQTRGVQVFKLMTDGTLEEKISSIIEKKRNLLDEVIKEDDPGMLKSFTREDLIEMLAIPGENR